MKYIISFLMIFSNNKIISQTNNNMEQIKKEILDSKKIYSEKPFYTAKVQIQACYYEIFLNDIPVYSYGVKGGMSNEIPLNSYILKSGKQILKFRLTPMFNQKQLSDQVDYSINLGYSEIIGENNLSNFNVVEKYSLTEIIKNKKLPLYEHEILFNAEVPWDYSDILENAQDLSNQSNLLNQTAKKFFNIINSRDSKKYFELLKTSLKIQSNVEYMSKKEIEELISDLDLTQIKKVYPLDEYEIILFANNKLVRFISRSIDENGNRYLFKYTVPPLLPGGLDGDGSFNYLFYLPKDEKELEVF